MGSVLEKVPVREQDPKVRATNFEEVCLGYNKEEAMDCLLYTSKQDCYFLYFCMWEPLWQYLLP